jgi:hypothetical protein
VTDPDLPPGFELPDDVAVGFAPPPDDPRAVSEMVALVHAMRARLARLEAEVNQLRGPKGASHVFLARELGTARTWEEVGIGSGGTSLVTLGGGRTCTATNVAEGPFVGRGSASAVLELRTGTHRSYVPISGGVDLYNGSNRAVAVATAIQMGTNRGMSNVMEYVGAPFPSGGSSTVTGGGIQDFKLPPGPGYLLHANSNTAGWDLPFFTE